MARIGKTNTSKKPGPTPCYTKDLAIEICLRLSSGQSLRQICKDPHIPSRETIYNWLFNSSEYQAEFTEMYNQARACQMEGWAEEIIEIADDKSEDVVEDAKGNQYLNKEFVMRSRVKIDARKWVMSKMAPKKYGDRIAVDHAGGMTLSLSQALDAAEGTGQPRVNNE